MFHGLDAVSVNSIKALKDQRLFRLVFGSSDTQIFYRFLPRDAMHPRY